MSVARPLLPTLSVPHLHMSAELVGATASTALLRSTALPKDGRAGAGTRGDALEGGILLRQRCGKFFVWVWTPYEAAPYAHGS